MRLVIIFALLLMTACGVKIKNFDKYEKTPLLELENMPSKDEIKNVLSRVLITKTNPANDDIKKSNAHSLIQNDITQMLQSGKFANIIERKEDGITLKEVKIAELEGKGTEDMTSVDYILDIDITNVTFSRQNVIHPNTVVTQQGVGVTGVNMYQYTSTVGGFIKIYQMPKMNIIKTIDLKGVYIESEQATAGGTTISSGALSLQKSDAIVAKDYDSNITYRAIKNAVQKANPQLKNFFKKHGYILEKRSHKKQNIFALNIGSESGVRSQDKLVINHMKEVHNPLTDETEEVKEQICKGTIADKIFENRSWVVFDNKCEERIRLGDKAEILY